MKLSIVATLYQSAPYVEEFHRRASAAARELVGDDYEIVLVNDGSPDNSMELAVQLTERDAHVVVVDLSRNFGHHQAMMAGLTLARGERIFLIDVDLEEEPEWLLDFHDQLQKDGCDVVYGVQKRRKGKFFERWSGELYYRLIDRLLSFRHPRNITTARLMKKEYVAALLLHAERQIVISGLWFITGFKQNEQTVVKKSHKKSSYSLGRKLMLLVDVITSFSPKPLIWIFFAGCSIFSLAFFYGIYLIVLRLFFSISVDGFTSIMVSIWFLGGLIILFIGLIGIYLSKIYYETKQRPLFIIRSIYGRDDGN